MATPKGQHEWTIDQFENWLSGKLWREEAKNHHRNLFDGFISFDGEGGVSYEKPYVNTSRIPTTPGEHHWKNETFEQWLSDKQWTESVKKYHRNQFKGVIHFDEEGSFWYI